MACSSPAVMSSETRSTARTPGKRTEMSRIEMRGWGAFIDSQQSVCQEVLETTKRLFENRVLVSGLDRESPVGPLGATASPGTIFRSYGNADDVLQPPASQPLTLRTELSS